MYVYLLCWMDGWMDECGGRDRVGLMVMIDIYCMVVGWGGVGYRDVCGVIVWFGLVWFGLPSV